MSLPPQIIRIKRKKVDEPVDTLYIESADRSKRRVTHHGTTFSRLKEEHETPLPTSPYSLHENNKQAVPGSQPRSAHGVPIVRATLPGEEEKEERSARPYINRSHTPITTSSSKPTNQPNQSARLGSPPVLASSVLRQFHLSKSVSSSYPSIGVSSPSGIQKRRKRQNKEIAVFEERRSPAKARETRRRLAGALTDRMDVGKSAGPSGDHADKEEPPSAPRKRPGANEAERKWRQGNWGHGAKGTAKGETKKANGIDATGGSRGQVEYSAEITEYLASFALEEAQKQPQAPPSRPRPAGERPATKLRTMPKVPARRYKDRHSPPQAPPPASSVDDAMELTPSLASSASSPPSEPEPEVAEDSEYTYDTYVRNLVPTQIDSTDPAAGKIGLLVITEDDQPIWDGYVEQSEPEGDNDDDEDSNAEDYYGADYPEDEVSSDDEHDVDAYKYRRHGSDDEEFGNQEEDEDEAAWSDNEKAAQYPWAKANWEAGSVRKGITFGQDDEDE